MYTPARMNMKMVSKPFNHPFSVLDHTLIPVTALLERIGVEFVGVLSMNNMSPFLYILTSSIIENL